jgi:8-oxo-dGTP pyrophosphatase MutT (NUDIX family)
MSDIVVPVPAATILVLRDGEGGLEVLMTKRHDGAYFAAGALVFPGGKVDPTDAALAAISRGLSDLTRPAPELYVAGVRETFEECGMLLARQRRSERLLNRAELKAAVARHGGGAKGFTSIAAEGEVELATDLLVPFAHWITPVDRPKRYDTHFFLAPAPEDQEPIVDGHEATELAWVRPADAIRDSEEKRINLVFATRMNLMLLGESRSLAEAMERARARRIVTVTPRIEKTALGAVLRIPAEAGYALSELPMDKVARA